MTSSHHDDPVLHLLSEELDQPALNEQAMIDQAISRGRRIRRRRTTVMGGLTLALTVGSVATVAALLPASSEVQVASTPSSSPTRSRPTASSSPVPSPNAAASIEYEQLTIPATRGQLAILRSHLAGFTITTQSDAQIDHITMELTDAKGTSWAAAGMGHANWHSMTSATPCRPDFHCVARRVPTGEVRTFTDQEKPGQGTWTTLVRDDGWIVAFAQRGVRDGSQGVTRPGRVLDDAQVRSLLTDPRWDKEFHVVPTSGRTVAPTPAPTGLDSVATTPAASGPARPSATPGAASSR